MDVAVPVRRRQAHLTLIDVLEAAPQLAEYLVPSLTNNENCMMIRYIGRATNYDKNSRAFDCYVRVYFMQRGWGYALRPPVYAS